MHACGLPWTPGGLFFFYKGALISAEGIFLFFFCAVSCCSFKEHRVHAVVRRANPSVQPDSLEHAARPDKTRLRCKFWGESSQWKTTWEKLFRHFLRCKEGSCGGRGGVEVVNAMWQEMYLTAAPRHSQYAHRMGRWMGRERRIWKLINT